MNFSQFITTKIIDLVESNEIRKLLLTDEALKVFQIAFTCAQDSKSPKTLTIQRIIHPKSGSYEIYEQIGDSIIKVFMTTYFYRRFPKIWNNDCGVKIVARLLIKYASKEVLSDLSKKLGFQEYIKFYEEPTPQKLVSILEDVFEAFIGSISIIIDCAYGFVGMGNIICYKILEKIYNQIDISLTYENLFDAKTRLKELIDLHKDKLGIISYAYRKIGQKLRVDIFWTPIGSSARIIASSASELKIKAEQSAAESALVHLKKNGFYKKVQDEYLELI